MSSITGNVPTPTNVLAAKDVNVTMGNTPEAEAEAKAKDTVTKGGAVKTMDFHRQALQSKMENQPGQDEAAAAGAPAIAPLHHKAVSKLTKKDGSENNYVSPSDEIMSPCTAKLSAFRNKQVGKYVLPSLSSELKATIAWFIPMLTSDSRHNRVKPKSLFAQASAKRMQGSEGLFGSKTGGSPPPNTSATI